MSAYDDRLDALQELARQALDAVGGLSVQVRDQSPVEVARLERVLGYAVVALDATDSDLLSETVRTDLTNYLNQIAVNPELILGDADALGTNLLDGISRLPVARDHDF